MLDSTHQSSSTARSTPLGLADAVGWLQTLILHSRRSCVGPLFPPEAAYHISQPTAGVCGPALYLLYGFKLTVITTSTIQCVMQRSETLTCHCKIILLVACPQPEYQPPVIERRRAATGFSDSRDFSPNHHSHWGDHHARLLRRTRPCDVFYPRSCTFKPPQVTLVWPSAPAREVHRRTCRTSAILPRNFAEPDRDCTSVRRRGYLVKGLCQAALLCR